MEVSCCQLCRLSKRKDIASVQSALAAAKSMVESIKSGGEWAWAQTPHIQGTMQTKIDELAQYGKDYELAGLLMMGVELKQVKTRLSAADLLVHAGKISYMKSVEEALTSDMQAAMRAIACPRHSVAEPGARSGRPRGG